MDSERQAAIEMRNAAFVLLGHDNPDALLLDAALSYNSTAAHNARAISAAMRNLRELLPD